MAVPDQITCVNCGETCHRMPLEEPELGWQVDDVVAYRCRGCHDMWYLELTEDDLTEPGEDAPGWF